MIWGYPVPPFMEIYLSIYIYNVNKHIGTCVYVHILVPITHVSKYKKKNVCWYVCVCVLIAAFHKAEPSALRVVGWFSLQFASSSGFSEGSFLFEAGPSRCTGNGNSTCLWNISIATRQITNEPTSILCWITRWYINVYNQIQRRCVSLYKSTCKRYKNCRQVHPSKQPAW